jgi:hypothetical protein
VEKGGNAAALLTDDNAVLAQIPAMFPWLHPVNDDACLPESKSTEDAPACPVHAPDYLLA